MVTLASYPQVPSSGTLSLLLPKRKLCILTFVSWLFLGDPFLWFRTFTWLVECYFSPSFGVSLASSQFLTSSFTLVSSSFALCTWVSVPCSLLFFLSLWIFLLAFGLAQFDLLLLPPIFVLVGCPLCPQVGL